MSFFDSVKSETAVSRWARARTRAAKVIFIFIQVQSLKIKHSLLSFNSIFGPYSFFFKKENQFASSG